MRNITDNRDLKFLQQILAPINHVRAHRAIRNGYVLLAKRFRQTPVMIGWKTLSIHGGVVKPVENQNLVSLDSIAKSNISAAFGDPHVKPGMLAVEIK